MNLMKNDDVMKHDDEDVVTHSRTACLKRRVLAQNSWNNLGTSIGQRIMKNLFGSLILKTCAGRKVLRFFYR